MIHKEREYQKLLILDGKNMCTCQVQNYPKLGTSLHKDLNIATFAYFQRTNLSSKYLKEGQGGHWNVHVVAIQRCRLAIFKLEQCLNQRLPFGRSIGMPHHTHHLSDVTKPVCPKHHGTSCYKTGDPSTHRHHSHHVLKGRTQWVAPSMSTPPPAWAGSYLQWVT